MYNEVSKCCANCRYYYEDYGMPCCKMFDIPEEDVSLEWCDAYEKADDGSDYYRELMETLI